MKPVIFTLPRCTSAELFNSCCDSAAALTALANCNAHVTKTHTFRPHAPTPSALQAPTVREVEVVKPLHFPVRNTSARATGTSCFPCQTAARSFLRFSAPPRPCSPAQRRRRFRGSTSTAAIQLARTPKKAKPSAASRPSAAEKGGSGVFPNYDTMQQAQSCSSVSALPASWLLLRARFCTCRQASAVAR
jgi:hypothetical protein